MPEHITNQRKHAVVIGASMTGLFAACTYVRFNMLRQGKFSAFSLE